jgi:two-component system OmpR family sensor kinase
VRRHGPFPNLHDHGAKARTKDLATAHRGLISDGYRPTPVSRFERLPIRVRVTLAFATVMAVVLTGVGLFLYVRLGAELDKTLERGLRSRAADVTALVEQADSGLAESRGSELTDRGENLAQIVDASGRVVDSTPAVRTVSLLSRQDRARALRGTITTTTRVGEDDVRLLATPVRAQDQRLVVVVGSPLEDKDEAVRSLGGLLLLGGPAALLFAALAGYGALTAALRPVEAMRRRAAAIQDAAPGQRLPVPPADDEIGRLGETLNAMLGRLEDAFARERAFLSDASHELRTPLAILKAELELALAGGRSAAELEGALGSAAEETDRLVQLAEDLLVIARSDQGRLPIRHDELQAREVLERVRERFARRARDRHVEITVAAPDGLDLVADPLRVEQAVGNLVDNALRHGGTRIELAAAARDGAIELHVRDDGAGFPPDFISVAFERFTRADSARGRGGAGLGLAIVAAIARAHGGAVAARNRSEGGADVSLTLPSDGPGTTGARLTEPGSRSKR